MEVPHQLPLLIRWAIDGTWEMILAAVLSSADADDDIDWAVSVGSAVIRAHQHAAGARKRGRPAPVNQPGIEEGTVGAGRPDVRHTGALPVDQGGVGLAGFEGVAFPPLAEGEQDGEEIAADVGEDVLQAAARGRGLLGQDSVGGELAQAVGEDVAGDAGPLLELGEGPCAVHRVPDDQEAPPVTDEVERAGHRAVGIGPGGARSARGGARHDTSR